MYIENISKTAKGKVLQIVVSIYEQIPFKETKVTPTHPRWNFLKARGKSLLDFTNTDGEWELVQVDFKHGFPMWCLTQQSSQYTFLKKDK